MTTSKSIMRGVLAVVVFGMVLLTLGTADAGGQLGTSGQHYNQPNHSGGGFGGCNKDGSFCWELNIDGGYHNPVRPYPGQVFGFHAKNMITLWTNHLCQPEFMGNHAVRCI